MMENGSNKGFKESGDFLGKKWDKKKRRSKCHEMVPGVIHEDLDSFGEYKQSFNAKLRDYKHRIKVKE